MGKPIIGRQELTRTQNPYPRLATGRSKAQIPTRVSGTGPVYSIIPTYSSRFVSFVDTQSPAGTK